MSAQLFAIFCTLLLLSIVANRSFSKPSRTNSGTMAEEKEREGLPSALYEEEKQRRRQKELSRDTFLRLNPNPRGEKDEENATGERGERDQQKNEAEGNGRPPLRDGDTLMALTSDDDALVEGTAQMDNCRGDLFKHKVRMPGCRPKTFVNRFCHGNCASFYIPRLRSKKLKATFQSCAACVPTETDLVQIQLDCPGREGGQLNRTIVRVKKCECRNIELEEDEGKEDENEEVKEWSKAGERNAIKGNDGRPAGKTEPK